MIISMVNLASYFPYIILLLTAVTCLTLDLCPCASIAHYNITIFSGLSFTLLSLVLLNNTYWQSLWLAPEILSKDLPF